MSRVERRDRNVSWERRFERGSGHFRRPELIESYRWRRAGVAEAIDLLLGLGYLVYLDESEPEARRVLEPSEGARRDAPICLSVEGEVELRHLW